MLKSKQIQSASSHLKLAQDKLKILDQRKVSKRDDEYKYWADRAKRLDFFVSLLNDLRCPNDHSGMVVFGKCQMQNSRFHVMARCSDCGIHIGQWISKNKIPQDILDNLPIFENYLDYSIPCEVCGRYGVELHHWAPRELFPESFEQWPKSYLCVDCHGEWHKTVTNPLRLLRKERQKYDYGKAA